jgi:hypothetical protein
MVLAASSLCSATCCVISMASVLTTYFSYGVPVTDNSFGVSVALAVAGAATGGVAIALGDKRLALASIGCFLAAVAVPWASPVLNKRRERGDIKLLLMSGLCASIAMFATFFAVFKN